jgi:hypothetical protein
MPLTTYTAGEVLTASSLNANFSFVEGAGGLTLVKTQTIGTTVASVVLTDVFSTDYDSYKIVVNGGVGSTAALLSCQLGATTTGYYWAHNYCTYAGSTSASAGSNSANFSRVGAISTTLLSSNFDLVNPFLAKNTVVNYSYVDPRTNGEAGAGGGFLNNTTSYTGFTFGVSSGTITGGTINIYGYKN